MSSPPLGWAGGQRWWGGPLYLGSIFWHSRRSWYRVGFHGGFATLFGIGILNSKNNSELHCLEFEVSVKEGRRVTRPPTISERHSTPNPGILHDWRATLIVHATTRNPVLLKPRC